MGSAVELLARQMDQAFEMVRQRLDGLTEEEFLWEPAPDCWTLRWMPIPRSVPEAVAMLDEGQGLLVKDLGSLEDEDLQAPRLTNWGEEWPAWRILWTMAQHDLWHGGEIGALRDLHRVSQLGDRKN